MIELIDLKATIKFIPKSEQKKDKPTTFYIKPSTWRGSLGMSNLFKVKTGSKTDIEAIQIEDGWFDYIVSRIDHIDNVGDLTIEEVLSRLSEDDGSELFLKIVRKTNLNESQSKN